MYVYHKGKGAILNHDWLNKMFHQQPLIPFSSSIFSVGVDLASQMEFIKSNNIS